MKWIYDATSPHCSLAWLPAGTQQPAELTMHRRRGCCPGKQLITAVWLARIMKSAAPLTWSHTLFNRPIMWSNLHMMHSQSHAKTVPSMCKCVCARASVCDCVRMWAFTQRTLWSCSFTLYSSSSCLGSPFEDHVVMIIKDAVSPLQTYGMNMDMKRHQTWLQQHASLRSRSAAWCRLI